VGRILGKPTQKWHQSKNALITKQLKQSTRKTGYYEQNYERRTRERFYTILYDYINRDIRHIRFTWDDGRIHVIYTETFVITARRVYKTHILRFSWTYLVAYVFIYLFIYYLTVKFIAWKKWAFIKFIIIINFLYYAHNVISWLHRWVFFIHINLMTFSHNINNSLFELHHSSIDFCRVSII